MITIEGNIVNKDGEKRARVEIDEVSGLIVKVGEPTGVADVVLKDELIFPGFIDLHVHAREDASHKQDYKEDFLSASEAAINGGVVAFAEMPNNPVPPVDDASYDEKKKLTEKSKVEIILYAGIGSQTNPLSKKVPYKVFMGHSIGDLFFTTHEALDTALARYSGQSVSFHCEDPKVLEECDSAHSLREQRPPRAEILAVEYALELIKKYNLVGRICHVSTIEGVMKIVDAKKAGVNVTVEVTPHHLFFDESMFTEESRNFFQVNPPIRQTKENRLALIGALKHGGIDYLATDHAPHTIEEKEKGISGLPLLDTYGSIAVWLMKENGFSPQDVSRVCAENPAKFINEFIDNKYGEIKEGFVGSLTVIDMNKKLLIEGKNMKTKCGWTPFDGIEFEGSVSMTIIKGKVYENK